MNKCACRFAVLLILASATTTLALQEGIYAQATQANTEQAWPQLMSDMEKMHLAMALVGSSGTSDTDFVRLMLPHHQAAIDMAETQLLFGKDPQMRRLAQEIIADQHSEMELMQLWLRQRGPDSQKTDQVSPAVTNRER